MSQYYFAVSTLPLLMFESEAGIKSVDFLKLCGEQLDKADLCLLEKTGLIPGLEKTGSGILDIWGRRETALRNESARQRAQKMEKDPEPYLRGDDYFAALFETVRDAVNSESPLAGEEILDRDRWLFLDQLEVGHYFDIEKLNDQLVETYREVLQGASQGSTA